MEPHLSINPPAVISAARTVSGLVRRLAAGERVGLLARALAWVARHHLRQPAKAVPASARHELERHLSVMTCDGATRLEAVEVLTGTIEQRLLGALHAWDLTMVKTLACMAAWLALEAELALQARGRA